MGRGRKRNFVLVPLAWETVERETRVFRKTEFSKEEQRQPKEADQGLILDNSNYLKGQPHID